MRSIDILVHRADCFHERYYLFPIAKIWEESGIEVKVIYEPLSRSSADLVILHTDITKTPVEYLAKVRHYPRAINGHVADISKRLVSRNLIREVDDYDGPVIVKTDMNSGASQERAFATLGYLPEDETIAVTNYQIFENRRALPPDIWKSKDWVVERFLPEIVDGLYCLRTWVFLGDQETVNRSHSIEPIVKGATTVKREILHDVPDELRALREELAFDYGKFDFVVSDGKPVLYDANRTPTLGILTEDEYGPRIERLAQGLQSFV